MNLRHIIPFWILFSGALALAAPAQVIIIRHGEKPENGNQLDARGVARANALPGFFQNNPIADAYGPPVAIFAMQPKNANQADGSDEIGSLRAIETVTPLARRLGEQVFDPYMKDEFPSLVQTVMAAPQFTGRTVVICWEHTVIPQMAQDFGLNGGPTNWPDSVFDVAWVLRFTNNKVTSFGLIPENVLPGDITTSAQANAEFY